MSWDPIVGIDLGTTNSLVAVVMPGQKTPQVIPIGPHHRLLPSILSLVESQENSQILIGQEAKHKKTKNSKNTVYSVKRFLGKSFEDIKSEIHKFPYPITSGAHSEIQIGLGDHFYSPVEISAFILRELKKVAERELKVPVQKTVITVPAYFNDAQRQATRTAARLAGLQVLRIINEPTAAALAYGLNRKQEGLIAVYDFGGGTFDVSILKLHNGVFEVLSTSGDTALGGDDLDYELAQFLRSQLKTQENAQTQAFLLEEAERIKKEFGHGATQVQIHYQTHHQTYQGPWLTVSEFEKIIGKVLDRTRVCCEQALNDAGIKTSELTDVLLVGGPTRLAGVQKTAQEIFNKTPNTSLHPDEVVALGAAIQADILAGNQKDLLLLDVMPLSLGIETYGGLMSVFLPRNSKIPTLATQTFTTFVDYQTGVDIHVFQGERDQAKENRSLAKFQLKGLEPALAGIPRIEVTFLVDADGILQVSARDLKTGNEQAIEVKPSFGLTDQEVEKMLEAGLDRAQEDVAFRRLVLARTEAEPVLRASEKNLTEAENLLEKTEVDSIKKAIDVLKESLGGQDPNLIYQHKDQLNQVTHRLAGLLVKKALYAKSNISSHSKNS